MDEKDGGQLDPFYVGHDLYWTEDLVLSSQEALALHFDFVSVPLFHPRYRRAGVGGALPGLGQRLEPSTRSDRLFPSEDWTTRVVGKVSAWLHFQTSTPHVQRQHDRVLREELDWAVHLSLRAALLPSPYLPLRAHGGSAAVGGGRAGSPAKRRRQQQAADEAWRSAQSRTVANYARSVNQALLDQAGLRCWLRLPLVGSCNAEERPAGRQPAEDEDSAAPQPAHEAVLAVLQQAADLNPRHAAGARQDADNGQAEEKEEQEEQEEEMEESEARSLLEERRPWELWDTFRRVCDTNSRLWVVLEIGPDVPHPNDLQIDRWLGEPVAALILHTEVFLTNKHGHPVLSKRHQRILLRLFAQTQWVILEGTSRYETGLQPYQYYLRYLYKQQTYKTPQERFEQPYQDYLQTPLQPLFHNLASQTYETFEKDPIKYNRYQQAVHAALLAHRDAPSADRTRLLVVMVVGAGRGPLVQAVLDASNQAGVPIRLNATEWEGKVRVVQSDMRVWQPRGPDRDVKADILVSELLGSFGDNELSPECLDGAARFLAAGGISIPCDSTSYLLPISSAKLSSEVGALAKSCADISERQAFETGYVVKPHNFRPLCSQPLPCFHFVHPNPPRFPPANPPLLPRHRNQPYPRLPAGFQPVASTATAASASTSDQAPMETGEAPDSAETEQAPPATSAPKDGVEFADSADNELGEPTVDNSRYSVMRFPIRLGGLVHGFIGYFHSNLFENINISIYPPTQSPGMFSWFPIFFPLRTPLTALDGSVLELHFWRRVDPVARNVWYEWCVAGEGRNLISSVHNPGGRSSKMHF
eukprot:g61486.t1